MTPEDIARSVKDWARIWDRAPSWHGLPCQQFPSDLWRYAEVLHAQRPAWVLEVGTADGGTAVFLADAGTARVISIDLDPRPVHASHPRLTLLKGDSKDPAVVAHVTAFAGGMRGLVLLDGDHSEAQVLAELDAYAPMANYLIVEDTLMEHLPGYGWGPHQALAKWLPGHPEFEPDPEPVPSNHPGGWLRRVSG